MADKSLNIFFESVTHGLRSIGVLRPSQSLKIDEGNEKDSIISFVIEVVISEFPDEKFQKKDFYEKGLRGEITIAKTILYTVLFQLEILKKPEIKHHFKITKQDVHQKVSWCLSLKKENKYEKKIIDKSESVKKKTVEYINKNKSENEKRTKKEQ